MRYDDAVLVAIEGHETDDRVLHWAARQATARRRPLVVVHVWEWSPVDRAAIELPDAGPGGAAPTPPEQLVRGKVAAVRAGFPGLRVSGELGYGRVTPVLLQAADGACLLVLGARGSGGFAGLQLGSVSAHVAAHAAVPVAVVRGELPSDGDAGRAVVVGVDGSAPADRALWIGVAEARRIGGTLVAVHGYRLPPLAATYDPHHGVDVEAHRLAAEEVLDHALHDVEAEAPDVKIERRVVAGPPARTLLDASYGAAAVVVGCRGAGGFAGRVFGSVSQQVVAHAHCPVVVAR